jgi:nucleotide-binding universal stress UspA family protein
VERKPWIVVGVDFSEAGARALDQALRLAARIDANVACVHAYQDAPGAPCSDDPTGALRARLEQTAASCGATARGVHVELFVRRGAPWDKLLNVACDSGAGVIVVGASATGRGSLGTVASRLIELATRMVLIVPSPNDVPHVFDERKSVGGAS